MPLTTTKKLQTPAEAAALQEFPTATTKPSYFSLLSLTEKEEEEEDRKVQMKRRKRGIAMNINISF